MGTKGVTRRGYLWASVFVVGMALNILQYPDHNSHIWDYVLRCVALYFGGVPFALL